LALSVYPKVPQIFFQFDPYPAFLPKRDPKKKVGVNTKTFKTYTINRKKPIPNKKRLFSEVFLK